MESASLPDTRALDVVSSLPADKKIRLSGGTTTITTAAGGTAAVDVEAAPSSSSSSATAAEGRHLGALPGAILKEIVSFTTESSLSGACRTTLGAIRELHYEINMERISFRSPGADPAGADLTNHMGLEVSGVLATGRTVVRITITHVIHSSDQKRHHARYKALEEAVRRVVQHSIPTLREISISG
ncbi:unnamed protein product, partial [Ectocarpus sp. 12 AP-2014]